MQRVIVYRNGSNENGKVVRLPTSLEELKRIAGQKLDLSVERIFTIQGGEIEEIDLIRNDEILYMSAGEAFISCGESNMTLKQMIDGLHQELLSYKLNFDVLFVGEAAAELLDMESRTKPKAAIRRPTDTEEITWDKTPNKRPLPAINETFKTELYDIKECKNSISHLMKKKRVEKDFLMCMSEDLLCTKEKLIKLGREEEVYKVIDKKSLSALERSKSVFIRNGLII